MTAATYSRITTLCTALAILSALLFDRVAIVRIPVAVVGIGAAVFAIVAYFRSRDAAQPEQAAIRSVAISAQMSDVAEAPKEGSEEAGWSSYTSAHFHKPTTHNVTYAFNTAVEDLYRQKYLLFAPGTVHELLEAANATVDTISDEYSTSVGNYEVLITHDGLFAVRQVPAHEQLTAFERALRDWNRSAASRERKGERRMLSGRLVRIA